MTHAFIREPLVEQIVAVDEEAQRLLDGYLRTARGVARERCRAIAAAATQRKKSSRSPTPVF